MDHQVLTERGINMPFKFEKLEVWDLSLEYVDEVYSLSSNLPVDENYNLKSQIRRAATSISLNIAEGSTGQTNPEQNRFLGYALRSLIETHRPSSIVNKP
jgi:four helix bundle protein